MRTINEIQTKNLKDVLLDKQNLLLQQIEQRTEPIIEKISDEKKDAAKEFWYNHFLEYVSLLKQIDYLIMEKEITPKDAYYDIFQSSNNIVNEGDRLEELIENKQIMNEIKKAFRDLSGYWVYRSEIIKHAYEKPFGYPGDYQIIELVYDNKPKSSGIGYCFDKYFLEYFYANAVRGRMQKMKEILYDFLTSSNTDVEILNIGCGPCREIRDLFAENSFNRKKIVFSLLDYDINALLYSNEFLKDSPANVEYKFIRTNVLDFIMYPTQHHKRLARKDLIYCLGLLDYLPERIIKQLIFFLYSLLNPEGKLIFAHKDSKNKPLATDWGCDWKFYLRNKNDIINIINNALEGISFNLESEMSSEIVFFLTIDKKSNICHY